MSQQPRAGKWATMAVVASGVFMATLDASIVNVSLPTFIDELDAPFVAVQWVVLGYLLVITGLLLPAGRASEILGRKRLFLWGFAVFTLGSLLAGFAGNVWALVAFRIVQAVGGAAMQAISPALVMEVFPARERGRALGLVLSAVSLGLVAGPVVGGLILGSLGWPFIFFINVPVGVAGTLLGWRVLPDSPPTGRASFDWYGTVALVAGLALMLLGLNGVQTFGLVSPFVLGTLGGAIVVLVAFVWWQRRGPSPIVHLELFRVREFSAAALAAFLSFIGVAAQILLLPFYITARLAAPGAAGRIDLGGGSGAHGRDRAGGGHIGRSVRAAGDRVVRPRAVGRGFGFVGHPGRRLRSPRRGTAPGNQRGWVRAVQQRQRQLDDGCRTTAISWPGRCHDGSGAQHGAVVGTGALGHVLGHLGGCADGRRLPASSRAGRDG